MTLQINKVGAKLEGFAKSKFESIPEPVTKLEISGDVKHIS